MKSPIEGTSRPGQSVWNLADAKNKFSEVVNLALHSGPQTISRRGEKVVVINEKTFRKLRGTQVSFIDFLFNGPSMEGLDLTRGKSSIREASL